MLSGGACLPLKLAIISKWATGDLLHNQLANVSTLVQLNVKWPEITDFQCDVTLKARMDCRRRKMHQ